MTEPADLTVVIPAWRASATIVRTLDSIAAQTLPPKHVVVVDDGSDDDTFDQARSRIADLAAAGIELRVIRQANAGPGAARNRALAEADTEFVAFIDADDEWLPTKIERSMPHLADPGIVLVSHDFWAEQADGGEVVADCTRHYRAAADAFLALYVRAYVATTTVVARRAAVMAEGGFEVSLPAAQDYDLWLKVLARPGAGLVVFPEALTRYHFSPQGITSRVEQRRRCSLRVMRRHMPRVAQAGVAGLAAVAKRVAVIHYEAVFAHWGKRQYLQAALCVPRLAVSAMAAVMQFCSVRFGGRRDHVKE